MSRGLGTSQQLMLSALAALEAQEGERSFFYVWAIVDQAYALSPEMQDRNRQEIAAREARQADMQRRADAGDDRATLYLALGRGLRRTRRSPRWRRTSPGWITENDFNPSRVLASLERRGLVARRALKGGGSASLTEKGRELAASLSVGTT